MQENVEVYKKIIDSNQKAMGSIKLRRSSGRLSDADFIEFELFDSKLKQDLITHETEATAAMAELEIFSGLSNVSKLDTQLEPKSLDLDNLNLKALLDSEKSKLMIVDLRSSLPMPRRKLLRATFYLK